MLPSDAGETWGLVVNEAMASGRPAVVSRAAGCCADLVVEHETGRAFECGDVAALAEILDGYAGDPDRAAREGRAAAARVGAFGLEAAAAGIVAAVRQVAGGGRAC